MLYFDGIDVFEGTDVRKTKSVIFVTIGVF